MQAIGSYFSCVMIMLVVSDGTTSHDVFSRQTIQEMMLYRYVASEAKLYQAYRNVNNAIQSRMSEWYELSFCYFPYWFSEPIFFRTFRSEMLNNQVKRICEVPGLVAGERCYMLGPSFIPYGYEIYVSQVLCSVVLSRGSLSEVELRERLMNAGYLSSRFVMTRSYFPFFDDYGYYVMLSGFWHPLIPLIDLLDQSGTLPCVNLYRYDALRQPND